MSTRRRVVAVTGASSGVGRACARAFSARGDAVGLIARNVEALKNAAAEAEAAGVDACVAPADVADAAQVSRAAAEISGALGPIDVWVNNAMVSVYCEVAELRPEEVARVTAVNYLGTVHGTLAALEMMRRRGGTIVQVGSGLAHRAIPLQAPYCASKHAVRAFTESLRVELRRERSPVRVTMVQLPGLNTPHFRVVRSRMPRQVRPVPPVYTPVLAARAVLHAADHPSRELVIGGITQLMILAQKIAPGLVDRYLARTGFDAQMTGEEVAPREGNLWDPLPGDQGVDGPFAGEARDQSALLAVARLLHPR